MPEPKKEFAHPCGIDRGIKRSFQLSTGEYFNVSDCSDIDRKINSLKRRKSKLWRKGEDGKRVKQSRLYRKLRREIIALYSRKTNIVRDFLHKLTSALSQAQDFIAVEKLEIANMTKSAKGTIDNPGRNVRQKTGLNRNILQQCWGKFVQFLKYKMEELGHVLTCVDPRDTSRTCPSSSILYFRNWTNFPQHC